MLAVRDAVAVVRDERRNKMILPNEIQQAAQNLGQGLRETSEVAAYLQAAQAVQDDPEAVAMEENLLALYQRLAAQERSGQALDQSELNEYYRLREQVRANPLIAAREEQLQMVKLIFSDVGQIMTSVLGVDFTTLAL
jgi:cell fate (sporulation/competence/biofilm development) regulator YlbF (YheA/YmcA/DUF963 family)